MGKTSRIIKKNVAINSIRRYKTFTRDPSWNSLLQDSPCTKYILLKSEMLNSTTGNSYSLHYGKRPPRGASLSVCIGRASICANIIRVGGLQAHIRVRVKVRLRQRASTQGQVDPTLQKLTSQSSRRCFRIVCLIRGY